MCWNKCLKREMYYMIRQLIILVMFLIEENTILAFICQGYQSIVYGFPTADS